MNTYANFSAAAAHRCHGFTSPGTHRTRFSFNTRYEDLNPVYAQEAIKMSKAALREQEDLLTVKQTHLIDQVKITQTKIRQMENDLDKDLELERRLVKALSTLQQKKAVKIKNIDKGNLAIDKLLEENQGVTDKLTCTKWCLRYSADKPYAKMPMQGVRRDIGLITPEEVRCLNYEASVITLYQLDNMGLAENPDFPDEILVTSKGEQCTKEVLHHRIIRYLLMQDEPASAHASQTASSSVASFVTEEAGLSSTLLEQLVELEDEELFSPRKKARHD